MLGNRQGEAELANSHRPAPRAINNWY